MVRFLGVLFFKIYRAVFLKFKVNKNTVLPKGPKIIAANHPTTTDPFLIYSMFPHAKVLIYKEIFNIKVLGWLFNRLGHIPVDYTDGKKAYNDAKRALIDGYDIIIFPEGGETTKSKIRDFKTGTIRLALETKAPIIPIGVNVEEKNIYRIKTKLSDTTTSTTRWYMFGRYTLNIGKSIRLRGTIKNRDYVNRKSKYLREEILRLSKR